MRAGAPRVTLRSVGYVDLNAIVFDLPDGRLLLDDVSFRVGEGAKVALVGAERRRQDHAAADRRRRPRPARRAPSRAPAAWA